MPPRKRATKRAKETGVYERLMEAFQIMGDSFGTCLVVMLIPAVPGLVADLIGLAGPTAKHLAMIPQYLADYPLAIGSIFLFLKISAGQKLQISEIWQFNEKAWYFFLLSIITVVLAFMVAAPVTTPILFWLAANGFPAITKATLAQIPSNYWFFVTVLFTICLAVGLYGALRFVFASWFVADQGLGPIDAMTKSWEMTESHQEYLFRYALGAFLFNLAGLLALVFGLLATVPATKIATSRLYIDWSKSKKATRRGLRHA
jgi:hypothetical protein